MKTLSSFLTVFAIQVFYAIMVYIIHKKSEFFRYWIIFQIVVTVFLHYFLYMQDYIYWYILPVSWILCVIISWYYSYHISKAGFFGHKFTFVGLLFFVNIPVIAVSGIVAIIYFIIDL